jgi:hypothetical protein
MFGAAPEVRSIIPAHIKSDTDSQYSSKVWSSIQNNEYMQIAQSKIEGGSLDLASKLMLLFAILVMALISGLGYASVLHGWETMYQLAMHKKKNATIL